MRVPAAALAAVGVFVLTSLLLMLVGAFGLRLVLGASTYRSSGVWVVVVIAAPAAAAVLSVAAFRVFIRNR